MSTAQPERPGSTPRAEQAAAHIAELAEAAVPGTRLGTKGELRVLTGVSVGTFNETLRLLQSRGVITVRPGPGGGIFRAEQSPLVRLGNAVLKLDAQATDVADAIRIRNALDPLLVDEALWYASPAAVAGLKPTLAAMQDAARSANPTAFIRANWQLHAQIAALSPNQLLRSIYTSLIDLIESHTLEVLPSSLEPFGDSLSERCQLHVDLVDAIGRRDREEAIRLIQAHNTTPHA